MSWLSSLLKIGEHLSHLSKPFARWWERREKKAEHWERIKHLDKRDAHRRKTEELLEAWRKAKKGEEKNEALRRYTEHLDRTDS